MKYPQKHGKPGNSTTNCSDIVIPYITKTQSTGGQKNAYSFPKKGDRAIVKDYRSITLTSIETKIYNALLRNRIEPEIGNILTLTLPKNQNGFRRNQSTPSQILTICRILGVRAKNIEAIISFIDFFKAFNSIHRGKMELILLAHGLPNEAVATIMMLYKTTKVKDYIHIY